MKKLMMTLLLLGALPLTMMAQDDDMYFVPTKENKAKEAETYGMPLKTYYAGTSRSVDDYNRQIRSSVTPIDSLGNDIIDFSAVRGVYPDSTYQETEDFQLTRRMSRFDDYTPSEAYWDGYRDGRWSSPWFYSSWYSWYDYDPWYWNNPWYYGGYYSWYSPWRYGYYGYYSPWYYSWYGPHWYGGGRSVRYVSSRPSHRVTYTSGRRFGERPAGRTVTNGNRTFGNNSSRTYTPSRSSNSSPSFGSGSSFGGGRSGGSFGGGGGGRSTSGGRNFGGRR